MATPLIQQRGTVDENKSAQTGAGYQRTGDDGLASSRRSLENAELVRTRRVQCGLLDRLQVCVEGEVVGRRLGSVIGNLQPTPRL